MEQNRIEFLDFAKGVGISLVVLAHAMSSQVPFLYSFLMPVFFFVSGYVFRRKPFGQLFLDKFNRLYVPFAFFFLCSWAFFLVPLLIKGNSAATSAHVSLLGNLLIGDERNGGNVPIWFLVCNFSMCLLYGIILNTISNRKVQTVLCIALGIGGTILFKYGIILPYKLDPAFSAILFFHLGNMARENDWITKVSNLKNTLLIPIVVLSFGISYYFSWLNLQTSGINKVNLIHNIVGDYIPFTLTGLFVLVWFMVLCYKLGNQSVMLRYYGRNSMVILGTHYVILKLVKDFAAKYTDVNTILFNVLISIFLMLFSLAIIQLAKRFVPALTGYDKLIKKRVSAGIAG
jgi:fucose 4-O-acetylase-like acetyltransferase